MEFKGTKGKWEFGGDTIEGKLISSRHPQNRDICTIWAYDTEFIEQRECKANALLISKAPEMLQMLTNIKDQLNSEDKWSVEQLIKQATDL